MDERLSRPYPALNSSPGHVAWKRDATTQSLDLKKITDRDGKRDGTRQNILGTPPIKMDLGTNPEEGMNVCKCIELSWLGDTLNSRRATPQVRLVVGGESKGVGEKIHFFGCCSSNRLFPFSGSERVMLHRSLLMKIHVSSTLLSRRPSGIVVSDAYCYTVGLVLESRRRHGCL
ncbi:hypothetical protein TNCV_4021211 [Trichonephila clavipes]|nr:hypothetical protein TNCV_4021211 [Trichonephila clavipes]